MSLLDRCIFTAVSAGTGDFVVSAAVNGYQTPTQAGAVDGTNYSYSSQSTDRTQWEEGDGVWTAATKTWARTNVTASSNGGAKVNYSAPPLVMSSARAKDLIDANNPLALRTNRTAPWDDFDAPDGTLISGRITPSNHTWGVTGVGAATAQINAQGYVNTALSYIFLTDTQLITEVSALVSWTAVSGQVGQQGTNGVLAFTSDSSNPVSATSKLLHLQFHPDGWNLLKSLTGPAGLVPVSGTPVELNAVPAINGSPYGGNLKVDGTRYKWRMVGNASAGTLTIYFPDGVVWQWTDPDITTILNATKTAFWEHSGNGAAGTADLRFHGCYIGPSKAGSVIEACTNKDTAILRGLFAVTGATAGNGGYAPRLTSPQIISLTGNGWYTIATQSADTGNAKMGGWVTLWGNDSAGRKVLVRITVGSEINANPPYEIFTTEAILGNFGGGLIDEVRLSQDNTNSLIQLDIHANSPNSNGATLHANYEGFFSPVTTPVVGAVALGSWSQVFTLSPPFSLEGNVGDLPPANAVKPGTRGFVKDSNQTLAAGLGTIVAGGGTNFVPVYADNAGNWRIG